MTRSSVLVAAATALLLGGCSLLGLGGFEPDEVVRHPDAPMLLLELRGDWARVAIYSVQENRMVPAGWVRLDRALVGWTIHKFDWEKFIKERARND